MLPKSGDHQEDASTLTAKYAFVFLSNYFLQLFVRHIESFIFYCSIAQLSKTLLFTHDGQAHL